MPQGHPGIKLARKQESKIENHTFPIKSLQKGQIKQTEIGLLLWVYCCV